MSKTIVLKDQRYLDHVTRYGHPESPKRLEAIYKKLSQENVKSQFNEIRPREAKKEEIFLNHSMEYVERIEKTAGMPFQNLDPDTNTSEGSWKAAVLAAGAVITGIDLIIAGEADNGFALVRPPGHHAEFSRAMGFCLFNNIAIGARYLMKKHNMQRILIVDWDIHHGNGTQNSFYSEPQVLYFSTHQFPYFPGTGSFEETGEKEGRGFTVNVPLPGGQTEKDYLNIFRDILTPIAEKFRPQFILVSAGYDIYSLDPLGTMNVTTNGFYLMTKFIKELAEKICEGRLLLTLEGGYHIEGLAESVKNTISALASHDEISSSIDKKSLEDNDQKSPQIKSIIEKARKVHSKFWSL